METTPYLSFRSSANLIILENGAIRSIPLELSDSWVLGRENPDFERDITLESHIVSRLHCKFEKKENRWYLKDIGSYNGTYLNGKMLPIKPETGKSDEYVLKNGDIIRIDAKDLNTPDRRGIWMMFSTEAIGNQWKSVYLRKKETHFGREEELCDVVIPLPYISGRHVTFVKNYNDYFVMDCDSMAGTWLNGNRVYGQMQLNEKDMISICDCNMIFTNGRILYNIPTRAKYVSAAEKPVLPPPVAELGDTELNDSAEADVIYNEETVPETNRPVILRANIISKKVPDNTGHGTKELVRDVQVEVEEGTLVALLGGAGAGKSTVMNCMNGMETQGMEGTVEYRGVDLLHNFDRMKYLIGSVPQAETFHETLKVEQELEHAAKHRLPGDTKKAQIKERVDYTLRQLGIEAIRKNRISTCSGGERRRVNIGVELVADRQLLCLDEPDAGLDPGNKRRLFETLRSLAHDGGKSILTIIHDVSDIELFDKVIIMNKVDNVGRLAYAGRPQDVKAYFGVDIKEVYQLMAQNPEKYIFKGEN